ncbi:MAG: 3-dehydroquinate synthase family protein [Bacteroidales bacterium]|jgi:3-dehydroquinate synthase
MELNFNFVVTMENSVKLLSCFSPDEIEPLLSRERHVVVIIDSKVKQLYGSYFPYTQIEIDASEKNKTLENLAVIAGKLMDAGTDRDSFILAVGGGITTDIAGFAASVYFRGVRFGFVPTTLLAQVDASIGGKNGVNSNGYKNILGTITQPQFTLLCPAFLQTLPMEEFLGGVSEMLKAFVIADSDSFFKSSTLLSGISKRKLQKEDIQTIAPYAQKAASIKAAIVERDMYEKGERKHLNLGHTFAHALERDTGIPHGQAVAIGICMAARLSAKLSLFSDHEANKIEEAFTGIGLETRSPVPARQLAKAMVMDKKKSGDNISFVLIERIGKCVTRPVNIYTLEELIYDLS